MNFLKILLLLLGLFNISAKAQYLVVKDETQDYKKRFCLVDTSSDAQTEEQFGHAVVTGSHMEANRNFITATGARKSDYYAYVDAKYSKASGLFLLNSRYGYSDSYQGIVNSAGEVLLKPYADASFIIDTIASRVYRRIYNYDKGGFIKLEVYDYQMNLINAVTEQSLGYQPVMNGSVEMVTWPLVFIPMQEIIQIKHSQGVMMLDKDLNKIHDYRNNGTTEYSKIRDFNNGFGVLEVDINDSGHNVLIDAAGRVIFDDRRSRIERTSPFTFESYNFNSKQTKTLIQEGNGFRISNCDNPFSSSNAVKTNIFKKQPFELMIGRFTKDKLPPGNEHEYALYRKIGCDAQILISDIDDDTDFQHVQISASHGFRNSKGALMTEFYLFEDTNGNLFFIDEYLEVQPMETQFELIEYRTKKNNFMGNFNPIWLYKINEDFFAFNPSSEDPTNELFGPFQSISRVETHSYSVGKAVYLMHDEEFHTTRLELGSNDAWTTRQVFFSTTTRKGSNNKQGVWEEATQSWVISPEYDLVHHFNGHYFAQNSETTKYDVYTENGILLHKDIRNYSTWYVQTSIGHPKGIADNGSGMTSTPFTLIQQKLKVCRNDAGRITSYIHSDFDGILFGNGRSIPPDFNLYRLQDGYTAGFRDFCDEIESFVWDIEGKVVWHSWDHYVTYDTRSKQYILKNFIVDPTTNLYTEVKKSDSLKGLITLQ